MLKTCRPSVTTFLPYSGFLSFFLHIPRFLQAVQHRDPAARQSRLPPALLNAVYLWGARISTTATVHAHEATFLQRANNALASASRGPQHSILYIIQAEVLLALYHFSLSRTLEGRYHYSAASALCLSCGLHKNIENISSSTQYTALPQPADLVEAGERLRAFWSVYIIDKSWAIAVDSPAHFNGSDAATVDVSWPLEMSDYEQVSHLHGSAWF